MKDAPAAAALEPLAAAETDRTLTPAEHHAELRWFIDHAITNHPRSLQVALGPSEVGEDCARRLAYKMLGTPEINPGDGWLATIGTAVHAWLEDVFSAANAQLEQQRFFTEKRVAVGVLAGERVAGSTDLFDRVTGVAVDFKVMGKTSLTALRRRGPSGKYRAQAHLYGRGWAALGHPVKRVAIWGLPRNAPLHEAEFWCEDYDEAVAVEALTRADGISSLASSLGAGVLPLLPPTDAHCGYCPYFRRGSSDLASGCPGHPKSKAAGPTSVESLVA
jgi:hypothetical protein